MKLVLIIASLVLAVSAFAVETNTECPMMKEKNSRDNPKASLSSSKPKASSKSSSSI